VLDLFPARELEVIKQLRLQMQGPWVPATVYELVYRVGAVEEVVPRLA
jgi:hypothetical protein